MKLLVTNGTGVASDFDGAYTLDLPYGAYDITVQYIGYESQTRSVTVTVQTQPLRQNQVQVPSNNSVEFKNLRNIIHSFKMVKMPSNNY